MNWRVEDRVFERFMDGASVVSIVEDDYPRVETLFIATVEQAIRNAIRRRERSKQKQRVAALLAEPFCETHGQYGCMQEKTCHYPKRKAANRG